jgi:hypothetical protein
VKAQAEFNFGAIADEAGYARWIEARQVAASEMARRLGLPIGHRVEVWLYGGVRLRGKLELKDKLIFIEADQVRHLELTIDRVTFAYREMESCVRLS